RRPRAEDSASSSACVSLASPLWCSSYLSPATVAGMVWMNVLERRLVGRAALCSAASPRVATACGRIAATGRRGPRIVGGGGLLATATASAGVAALAAGTARTGDLGRRASQTRADFVDVDLGALPARTILALELADLEAALHDHAHALLEGLRDVLGRLAPYRAGQEQRVAVLPLAGLPVELTRCRGEPEVGNGRSGRGETQLGMVDEIADHGDDGVACHGFSEKVGGLLVAVNRRLPTSGRVLHRRGR